MLTLVEKILFIALALASLGATAVGFRRIVAIIRQGEGDMDWSDLPQRTLEALTKTLSQRTVLGARRQTSWFHAFVAWGFFYYFLVNLGDVLEGFIGGPLRSNKAAEYIRTHVPGVWIPDPIVDRLAKTPKTRQREEGIRICVEIIQQVREIEGIHGVHVMAYRQEETVTEIIHRAGLLPRQPQRHLPRRAPSEITLPDAPEPA